MTLDERIAALVTKIADAQDAAFENYRLYSLYMKRLDNMRYDLDMLRRARIRNNEAEQLEVKGV